MKELKPCPFCGGKNLKITKDEIDVMVGGKGSVFCRDCYTKSPVSKWNTRHEEQRLAESLTKAVDVGFKFNSTIRNELDAAKAEIAELLHCLSLAHEWLDIDSDYRDSPICEKINETLAEHKGE